MEITNGSTNESTNAATTRITNGILVLMEITNGLLMEY